MNFVSDTICVDCGRRKRKTHQSGSFQCEKCQDELIIKIRKGVGGKMYKTTIEKVEEMTEKGLSPKEIAHNLKMKVSTVYTYQSQIRKAKDETADSENETEQNGEMVKKRIKELVNQNGMLKKENEALKQAANTPEFNCEELKVELDTERERHQALFKYMMSFMREK